MEYNKNRDPESLLNYKNLKEKLEKAISKVRKTADTREAKGFLIEVQNAFKGLKLVREDREELYTRLQQYFAEINKRVENEKVAWESEALENYTRIKNKVEEAAFLASNPKDIGETWNYLLEVQGLFKGVKLMREHREALYSRLQEAFDKLKSLRELEKSGFEKESSQNYPYLKKIVEDAVDQVSKTDDRGLAREILTKAQADVREAKLVRENRDELLAKIQEAFTEINIKYEEDAEKYRIESEANYLRLKPRVVEISEQATETVEFFKIRSEIKEIQAEMRETRLLRENREELHAMLQEAFETLNLRQDEEQGSFRHDAHENYIRLKALVRDGLQQAEESHEYKETREFLIKIQSEFKGIKLIKEQREELYARLQAAFDILSKRVDEYFHEKKKNWEVKMQYKVAALDSEIYSLNESLDQDFENLQELEDHLDIIESSGKDTGMALGLKARISSARISIQKKEIQIRQMTDEMNDLKNKLGPV